jgi:5-methylcytosine-specific restriction endonuclease McrA
MTENSVPQKRCTNCGETKPIELFGKDKNRKGGHYPHCKECVKAKSKEWRKNNPEKSRSFSKKWYDNNREHKLAKNQEWYDAHPEKIIEKQQKRYWSNPEKERARSADYKARNPEKIKIKSKRWQQNHPEQVRHQARIRRIRKLNAPGTHSIADEKAQFKMQKGCCWWCGKKIKGQYHVDHRIALSRGGSDWPNNICISCPRCNESKHNKMPWEWNGRLL